MKQIKSVIKSNKSKIHILTWLFNVFGEGWIQTIEYFLTIRILGFGRRKKVNILWNYTWFEVPWCIGLKRNAQIFQIVLVSLDLLWDKKRFLASLWCSAHGFLMGYCFLLTLGLGCHCPLYSLVLFCWFFVLLR